ncbi:hypothetical protein [Alicyclobacillus dauci]|uniref:Uncharacterized protein n=1 Tax=Alicyclobacillus dauci TaxID=1475485 RepID=A0ABY6Z1G0_9BACL|nr:hypothetical protein [Alicyclobacillus dauci]WAH35810.1 hypothetical protein NZD86_16255 [Alicyclobacillus dauci]
MRSFDQLDWVHQFGDYEMFMYVQADGTDEDGIYIQLLQRNVQDGAEQWDILYDRRLSSATMELPFGPEDPAFEEAVLRHYLDDHPTLVDDEKTYLANWLKERE